MVKKKKKGHEMQNLEIDAEQPVTSPRPGWHRHHSALGSGQGAPRAGLAFSTAALVQRGGGSDSEEGAVLTAAAGALLGGALSLELSCPQRANPLLSPPEPRELSRPLDKRSGGLGGREAVGLGHGC